MCDFCEKNLNKHKKFCCECGKNLENLKINIDKNIIEKIFLDQPFMIFITFIDKIKYYTKRLPNLTYSSNITNQKYYFMYDKNNVDNMKRICKLKNLSEIDYIHNQMPIYHPNIDNIINELKKHKYEDTYIIEIVEYSLEKESASKYFPIDDSMSCCRNNYFYKDESHDLRYFKIIIGKIKKINIYSKKEYEEKYSFLHSINNWIEKLYLNNIQNFEPFYEKLFHFLCNCKGENGNIKYCEICINNGSSRCKICNNHINIEHPIYSKYPYKEKKILPYIENKFYIISNLSPLNVDSENFDKPLSKDELLTLYAYEKGINFEI